ELGFPMMAGSSVPVAWRRPPLAFRPGVALGGALAVGFGGLEAYGFHTLELLQAFVERRRGGVTRVAGPTPPGGGGAPGRRGPGALGGRPAPGRAAARPGRLVPAGGPGGLAPGRPRRGRLPGRVRRRLPRGGLPGAAAGCRVRLRGRGRRAARAAGHLVR